MSRLVENDICNIETGMGKYDHQFMSQTGLTMRDLAIKTVGYHSVSSQTVKSVASVPVTTGLGIIGGFSDSIASIFNYYDIPCDVTSKTDVTGFQEAEKTGKDVVFMADDDTYVAVGMTNKGHSDNGEATGMGFAEALLMAIKKSGKEVLNTKILVLGAGPVGRAAAKYIDAKGAIACVYDIDEKKSKKAVEGLKNAVSLSGGINIADYLYMLDATPTADIIKKEDVTKDTIVSAPGMPLGITKEARKIAQVIHNPLELGTLVMYYQCVKMMEA